MNNLFLSHKSRRRWLILVLLFLPLLLFGLIRLADAAAVVSFSSQTSYNVGAGPYWAATFNKFGKPAIAVTNQNDNSVSVLYGNYSGQFDGTFGGATTYSLVTGAVTTPAPQQVVAGNLGQLSLPSLVIAAAGANKVAVLLGNSDDSFQAPVYYNVGAFPESVALGDVNGDGNLDIIAANYDSSTISVLLGNSDRTFQSQQTYATSPNPESIVVADFNSDGKVDVATVNSGTNPGKVNVLLNVNGTFPSAVTSDVGAAPFSLAVGDFNGDGKVDIVTANHGGGVSILLNNGVRPFPAVAPAPVSAGSAPYSVAVGDFNLDGQADIAVSNADNGGSVAILPNSGGSFQGLQVSNTFSTGPSPLFIAVGDFNVDGKPDIVTPNHPNPVVNPGTISVLLNTAVPFASPPPNDNFANAQDLNSIGIPSGRVTSTNVGATHESSEPNHAGLNGVASVWYKWTAPATGAMTVDTFGSTFDTVLVVYKGSDVAALTLVGSNNDDHGPNGDFRNDSRVSFTAVAGTTYRIAVDGKGNSATGNITLNWYLLPSPLNDNFASAQTITGSSGGVSGTNAGATKEVNEPDHPFNAGGASVWYRWVPPSDGTVSFTTSGSFLNTLLAIYTGSLGNLTLIARATSLVSFSADHTQTYFIALDGLDGATNDFVLSWGLGSVPNQNFDQAQLLVGGSGSAGGPSAIGLWYVWTAPSTGGFFFSSTPFGNQFSSSGSQVPSTISVYTGSSPNSLTTVGTNTGQCSGFSTVFCGNARVDFNATSGVVYHIFVSGPFNAFGGFALSWGTSSGPGSAVPLNDNFNNAAGISGFAGSAGGTLVGATLETNEPNHAAQQGGTGGTSVWYNWTPQRNVNVTFTSTGVCQEGFSATQAATSIGIYQGSTLSGLVEVTKGIGNCVSTSSSFINTPAQVTFSALQGTTYRISIDRKSISSAYGLTWFPNSVPLNDAFSSAQPISGQSGRVEGYTNFSTSEAEPSHGLLGSFGSVWYNWNTPSTSGLVTFSLLNAGSNSNVVAVYSGNTLNSLSPVVAGRIQFYAVANSSYFIAVAAPNGSFSKGAFTLRWGVPATISGRVSDIRGVGIANIQITLSGDGPVTQTTDSQGNYAFIDLIQGRNYTVTPSVSSFTYDVPSRSYNPLSGDVTNANFVAKTPTYFITGRLTSNGAPLANITVNLAGTDIQPGTSLQTTSDGKYTFSNLTTNGDFTVTPSSPSYTFNATIFPSDHSYTFKTLNQGVNNADFTGNAVTRTLTVASLNPANGANISITPNDNGGQPGGLTPFTRIYDSGQTVNLTAAPTANGNNFLKWQKDGVDFSMSPGTSVLMDANHTMTAVYVTPTRTLTVASTNVAGGVNITVSPNDNNNQGGATTQFTRTYDLNKQVTLTAPQNSGNSTFQKWQKDGADYSTSLTTNLTIDADHTMTAVYITTSSQTPTGQNVAVQLNGVTVTFSNVSTAGTTTIMPINPASAGQLPNSYQLTGNPMAFDISTTAVVQPPISVCFNVQPPINDAGAFAQLRILHNENGTLVDRTTSQNFATQTICANVNSLSPFVLASSNLALWQLLLEDIGVPQHAAALDALRLVRDPFSVINPVKTLNPASDPNTRVLVFVNNLQLAGNETAAAVKINLTDSNNHSWDIDAEDVRVVPNRDFSQIKFRLPDGLPPGICTIQIRLHGQVSNTSFIQIKP